MGFTEHHLMDASPPHPSKKAKLYRLAFFACYRVFAGIRRCCTILLIRILEA